jgi:hypothetical protein
LNRQRLAELLQALLVVMMSWLLVVWGVEAAGVEEMASSKKVFGSLWSKL